MLGSISEKIAEWIIQDKVPAIKETLRQIFSNTIFHTMSSEELQILFLKYAIEAVFIIGLWTIGVTFANLIRKKEKSRKGRQKKMKSTQPKVSDQKKWSPTGWYWDDESQSWIPPDYLSQESRNRWKWDPEKKIWIDQEKDNAK